MHLDPRIGKLNNGQFYCFPHGYSMPEFVGTQEAVEVVLGVREPTVVTEKPVKKLARLRDYLVTITPRIVTYAGSGTFGEYTVTVSARSNGEAITAARRERNENEGRYGVPASYRAKLAEEG